MILVHFRHRFSKYETQSVPKVNLCFSPDCKNGTVSMLIIRILIDHPVLQRIACAAEQIVLSDQQITEHLLFSKFPDSILQ